MLIGSATLKRFITILEDLHHGRLHILQWMIKYENFAAHIIKNKAGEPGTIIATTKQAIIVGTQSDDAIAITDMQLAGKNVCPFQIT